MSNVTPFPIRATQIVFDRRELNAILGVYGRMVAAGHWRDYAIDLGADQARFAAFRRASEQPDLQLLKTPELRNRQGMYALIGEAGVVLKRGHVLASVLAPIERKLLKLVDG